MTGITIQDTRPGTNVLAFDLRDILTVLGPEAAASNWTATGVECLGAAAAALHRASEDLERLPGSRLIALADAVDQIIDGEFIAYAPGAALPWVTIRAVDSSAYDVITEREDVLRSLRARFSRVEEIPA